jgi:hypothetical protein
MIIPMAGAILKEIKAMTWNHGDIGKYRSLTDNSDEAINIRALACRAYENHYQRAGDWEDLNPQVRDHWCAITAAIVAALQERK